MGAREDFNTFLVPRKKGETPVTVKLNIQQEGMMDHLVTFDLYFKNRSFEATDSRGDTESGLLSGRSLAARTAKKIAEAVIEQLRTNPLKPHAPSPLDDYTPSF